MAKLLLINGPNLDLLGQREPGLYGQLSLADIEARSATLAAELGHQLTSFQSNAEHALVERVHQAGRDDIAFILINPAAFTHTSVALRDALIASERPVVEVHLSNVHAREAFRRHSYVSDVAWGVVTGFGPSSYRLGLDALLERLSG